jgi:hypothetical protein
MASPFSKVSPLPRRAITQSKCTGTPDSLSEMAVEISFIGLPHQGQSGVGIDSADGWGGIHRGRSYKLSRFFSILSPEPAVRPAECLEKRRRFLPLSPPLPLPLTMVLLRYFNQFITQHKGYPLDCRVQVILIINTLS